MLLQRINAWAAKQPDHVALIEGDDATSYAQFARMIEAVRAQLEGENVPAGQFAIVMTRSATERWVTTLALGAIGVHVVNVATLQQAVDLRLKNVACIAASEEIAARINAIPVALGPVRVISVPQNMFDRRRASVGALPSPATRPGPAGGYVVHTSGTTGAYKKVFFDTTLEEKLLLWAADANSFDTKTVFHALYFPLWTTVGSVPLCIWFAGGCVVVSGRGNPYGDFFVHRPTKAILVPTMLEELLALRSDGDKLETGFELILGGGFVPLRQAELAVQRLTPNVTLGYGSSEVSGVMRQRFHSDEDLHWLTPHKSNFEIVDDAGNECAPGIEGELRIRKFDFDSSRYLDDDEANARFFRDGCFYPGDLAVRRADGRIRVLGRTDDVVNVRGWKIPVAPVEISIQQSLGVDTVCIFTERDASGEETIVIALECDRLPPEERLAAAIRDRKGFDRVRWSFLESFPRTEGVMNKVNRRELRALLLN